MDVGPSGDCRVSVDKVAVPSRSTVPRGAVNWLEVQWSPHACRVLLNGEPFWFDLEKGPGGTLREVKLVGVAGSKGANPGLEWSRFAAAAATDEPLSARRCGSGRGLAGERRPSLRPGVSRRRETVGLEIDGQNAIL